MFLEINNKRRVLMKIAIITSGYMPVPATKGGAVETLVENIIYEREKIEDNNDIYIFTDYDKKAWEKSKKYKNGCGQTGGKKSLFGGSLFCLRFGRRRALIRRIFIWFTKVKPICENKEF